MPAKAKRHLLKRGGVWIFARRVPIEFANLDPRGIIKKTTKVRMEDDPRGSKAGRIAEEINRKLEEHWKTLIAQKSDDAHERFAALRKRARSLGFEYMPAHILAEQPTEQLLARLDALAEGGLINDASARSALLGGELPPQVHLSELFGQFERLVQSELQGLSESQIKKWKSPKIRAAQNLISVVGNKPIAEVSANDALDFADWWRERILAEGLSIETANKDIGHLGRMFRVLHKRHRTGVTNPFIEARIDGGEERSRLPFDPKYVSMNLLRNGALADLDDEARRIVFVMIETGMRPSEVINLNEKTILLADRIPHVQIREDGRRLKTTQSKRDIPLVGVALEALKVQPNGFPRYKDRGAVLSTYVNKFLREMNLRQNESRSLYSLRHTFKDRLIEIGAPDSLIDSLMGHSSRAPKYGSGPSLELKLDWLKKIAFRTSLEI